MKRSTMTSTAAVMTVLAGAAQAECGIESGLVRILSNDFAALHAVADFAELCAAVGVEVTRNATEEHKSIQVPALTIDPATYSVAVVATNSVLPLLNNNLIRPLDEYVAQYGDQLRDGQLIRIGDEVMAIAFMANAQHLIYREDIRSSSRRWSSSSGSSSPSWSI